MKSLTTILIAAALVGGAGFVERADAGDGRKGDRKARVERRIDRRVERRVERRIERRDVRYFGSRDIVIIRDYYRPHYRPLPRRVRHQYVRDGYLPAGWDRRIHPVPVYVERHLPVLPHGHRRGIIDGHVVVHNAAGLILDVALLF